MRYDKILLFIKKKSTKYFKFSHIGNKVNNYLTILLFF